LVRSWGYWPVQYMITDQIIRVTKTSSNLVAAKATDDTKVYILKPFIFAT
jgi:hypothetical protein